MKPYLIIVLCLFITLGCKKKELPPVVTNAPVFYFEGTADSTSVLFEAGKNNQYMYSDFSKDSRGLYTFTGKFAPQNCSDCEPSLAVEINANVQVNAQIIADLSALSGQTLFNSYSLDSIITNTVLYTVTCNPKYNANVTNYLWDFGDGTFSVLQNPSHTYITGGIKHIKLTTTGSNFTDSIIQTINLNNPNIHDPLQINSIDTFNNSIVLFATVAGYTNYNWDFGDLSPIFTGQTAVHNYSTANKFNITLNATNTTDTNISRLRVDFTNGQAKALPSFSITKTISTLPVYTERINLTSCIITWKQNGKIYKSYKVNSKQNQSNIPIFKLLSFKQYEKNELGKNTLQLTGDVDTYMYNVLNELDSVKLKSTRLSFAVAIP
jgi:PKD repeat protein